MTEAHAEPADLAAMGWQRRLVADSMQAQEATAFYTSLEFAVHAEPRRPAAFDPRCGDCQLLASQGYTQERCSYCALHAYESCVQAILDVARPCSHGMHVG